MLLWTTAKAAAAGIAGTLTVASGRNMLQTYQIAQAHDCWQPENAPRQNNLCQRTSARPAPIRHLQSLSRAELLKLYLQGGCEAPLSPAVFLDGAWNGVLLHNGPVLTRVVTFITNQLFGKGRRWNGKTFDTSTGCGHNRFVRLQSSTIQAPRGGGTKTNTTTDSVVLVVARTEDDQPFQFSLCESRLGTGPAVVLDYARVAQALQLQPRSAFNRPWWSPWKYMVDEIRVVPCNASGTAWNRTLMDDPSNDWDVLLGWGAMGWSGGRLNASPFCLYRRRQKQTPTK
jgi:hypothetical protein